MSRNQDEKCPKCSGAGRIEIPGQGWEAHPGLVCLLCDGTGNAVRARIRRAYDLGYQAGIDGMRNAWVQPPDPDPFVKHLRLIWEGDILDG